MRRHIPISSGLVWDCFLWGGTGGLDGDVGLGLEVMSVFCLMPMVVLALDREGRREGLLVLEERGEEGKLGFRATLLEAGAEIVPLSEWGKILNIVKNHFSKMSNYM